MPEYKRPPQIKRGSNTIVSPDVIEFVFGESGLWKKFPRPKLAKNICQYRSDGMRFKDIGRRCRISAATAEVVVKKALWLYKLNKPYGYWR